MYKYSLSIPMIALILGGATSKCYALTEYEADKIEKQALDFCFDKDYKSAFRIISQMIEKAEASTQPETARFGYSILQQRTLIANEALADITTSNIARVVCESNFDNAIKHMRTTLHSKLAVTADRNIYSQKSSLLNSIKEKYATQKDSACVGLSNDAIIEEKAASILMLENQRILKIKEVEERTERERLNAVKEAEETVEKNKLATARTIAAPSILRNNWDTNSFCVNYGQFLRGTTPLELVGVNTAETLLRTEATRRGLALNKKTIVEQKIHIGMSECGVYAAWGSPFDINRTVGSWGVHKQLIYGSQLYSRKYIYIQNGRVSTFQD